MRQPASKRPPRPAWQKNLLFAVVVLALAAVLGGVWLYQRRQAAARPDKVALLVYGDTERREVELDLREDGDYTFASFGYEIHVRVQDGSAAFVDSPCPDHVCEQFGWLHEVYDWAACMPAQAMLRIVSTEDADNAA